MSPEYGMTKSPLQNEDSTCRATLDASTS